MTYSEKLKDPRWQKKRLEILSRDNWCCRFCGDNETTLNVHHIYYNGNPWESEENQLITLCENCHKSEEEYLKDYSKRIVKSLRMSGMTAYGLISIMSLFEGAKDRGWGCLEDGFEVLKYCINNDEAWSKMKSEYEKQFK